MRQCPVITRKKKEIFFMHENLMINIIKIFIAATAVLTVLLFMLDLI